MDNLSDVINSIELNLHNNVITSNLNRAAIMYLLKKCPENELKAETIAYHLGVSHRTALYHLNILEMHGYVEVRKYVKKGFKKFRSIWGLSNGEHVISAFEKINKKFSIQVLEDIIQNNTVPR